MNIIYHIICDDCGNDLDIKNIKLDRFGIKHLKVSRCEKCCCNKICKNDFTKWISVKDKLPEPQQLISCRIKGESGYINNAKYLKFTNKATTEKKHRNRTEITQWKFDEWKPAPKKDL